MSAWLRRTASCFLACIGVWLAGMFWFASQIPMQPADQVPAAEAIVVLTGGSGRLEYGFQLLAEGRGQALFVSGVYQASRPELLRKAPAEIQPVIFALPKAAITFGRQAENTIGNAEETANWVHEQKFRRILLVTSNYHMPRALAEFEVLMPEVTLLPAPVFPEEFALKGWWLLNAYTRDLVLSEYHKLLAGKLRHWLVSL